MAEAEDKADLLSNSLGRAADEAQRQAAASGHLRAELERRAAAVEAAQGRLDAARVRVALEGHQLGSLQQKVSGHARETEADGWGSDATSLASSALPWCVSCNVPASPTLSPAPASPSLPPPLNGRADPGAREAEGRGAAARQQLGQGDCGTGQAPVWRRAGASRGAGAGAAACVGEQRGAGAGAQPVAQDGAAGGAAG